MAVQFRPMKHLTLLRHAKAVDAAQYTQDIDRPLAKKGGKQIARVAPLLQRTKQSVDHIVSSPALRANQTAQQIAKIIKYSQEVSYDDRIYEASVTVLLTVLRELPESAEHVLIVGHNPGLEELISALACGDEGRLSLRLSTAGLVHFHMEIARWQQVRWGCGLLRLLTAPRFQKKR